MKDWYKVKVIDECLDGMKKDEYTLTRLKGDHTKAINIDIKAKMADFSYLKHGIGFMVIIGYYVIEMLMITIKVYITKKHCLIVNSKLKCLIKQSFDGRELYGEQKN